MSRKVKLHETHAFEIFDALEAMRRQLDQLEVEGGHGLSVRSHNQARALRDKRIAEWDRSALGRLYWMLRKRLH